MVGEPENAPEPLVSAEADEVRFQDPMLYSVGLGSGVPATRRCLAVRYQTQHSNSNVSPVANIGGIIRRAYFEWRRTVMAQVQAEAEVEGFV